MAACRFCERWVIVNRAAHIKADSVARESDAIHRRAAGLHGDRSFTVTLRTRHAGSMYAGCSEREQGEEEGGKRCGEPRSLANSLTARGT